MDFKVREGINMPVCLIAKSLLPLARSVHSTTNPTERAMSLKLLLLLPVPIACLLIAHAIPSIHASDPFYDDADLGEEAEVETPDEVYAHRLALRLMAGG